MIIVHHIELTKIKSNMKIISGGQTGADIAGVEVALKHGFETGGSMPRGWITLKGSRPDYKNTYGMKETVQSTYPPRTELNVKESDCTIWFGQNKFSAGKLCTFKYIRIHKKPSKDIDIDDPDSIDEIADWIKANNFNIINIAGNSETSVNNMEKRVSDYLDKLFDIIDKK